MNAESVKQRTFAILYDKTEEPSHYDRYTVREWLKDEGWPTLFPGHCFTCHMNEDRDCKPYEHLSCPGCVKEEREYQMSVLAAAMPPPIPATEEMKKLFKLDGQEHE